MFSDSFKVEKLKLNELNVSRKAEIESKIFPFKHFHDSPKRVFNFRVVREFVFLFVFSSSLFVNHFQSAKEQSLQKMNLVSLYSNRKSPFPKFRSLYVVVWKVISLIFFQQQICLFPFFTMPPNDWGYGHWRFAWAFTVAQATKWMRAQRPLNALQPPTAHRRVLCVRCLLKLVCFRFV